MPPTGPLSRRTLLRSLGLGAASGLAGCSSVTRVFPQPGTGEGSQQSTAGPLSGRVRDTAGEAVTGATVEAVVGSEGRVGGTTTDDAGRFRLRTERPVWLRVTAPGYIERLVAGAPGTATDVTVVGAAGTAALAFGGDVMFARRFYDRPTDPLNPHAHIRESDRRADHDRILAGIKPLLQSADVTSVNLETPLTQSTVRHPDKRYEYASHPVAGRALADAGVDYVALGNNHAFDALQAGLADTTRTLDAAGIEHSGAGQSPSAAWRPATTDVAGVSIAMLSCTTLVGDRFALHWSADRSERGSATDDGTTTTVPAGVGVAEATPDRLADHVAAAADRNDVVVVQIHGGEAYQSTPTPTMRRLTETAAAAGADLVVNHHPHVTGGLETLDGAVVAWSLGNLVFDQTLWQTLPSALLTAYVTADGVERVVVDPLLLEGFVPRGVVGKPNRALSWRTAGRSDGTVSVTPTGLAGGTGVEPATTTALDFSGDRTYARKTGPIRAVERGAVRLGRDLLPTGTFESVDVDGSGYDGTLWRFSRTPPATGASFGYEGSGGIRLQRIAGNSQNVVLSNAHRIPVDGDLTLTARYRTAVASGLTVELAWYADTDGSSIHRDSFSLPPTGETWGVLSHDFTVPDDATHLNCLVILAPPNAGTRTAFVDDVRLVSWADRSVDGGREFDHARVESDATVRVAVPTSADGAAWRHLDGV
ncbi:CapA family protein [Halomicroarcula sp. GCM10025324]|uniref:CapA family protein n=1 Tax=Haloarcula TaxID=2237 RepID=UPI0023E8860A|nr:CapA family protein [Halomicroarcula sp. ZS-22-S1]